MAAQRSQTAAARALNANKTDQTGPHPGRDRRRINEALDRIGLIEARQPVDMGCFGYAGLSVAETCTACGVCGRACPSGALTFTQNKGLRFELNFEARNCIGCEICSQVCAPQAISVDHHPGYQVIFSKEPIQILHQGRLVNCERCNTLFASETDIKLCPLCRVRRESPFGTQLPESLKHIQESIDKRKAS